MKHYVSKTSYSRFRKAANQQTQQISPSNNIINIDNIESFGASLKDRKLSPMNNEISGDGNPYQN